MKKKLLKKIIVIGGVSLIIGIPTLYSFVTSSFFIKAAVLPTASKYAGFRISAKEVNFSLFKSSVSVSDLEAGSESKPFLKVAKAEAAWGLRELIAGNIKIDKLHVSDGNISINEETLKRFTPPQESPGTPEKKEDKKEPAAAPAPSAPLKLKLDIKNVSIEKINADISLGTLELKAKNLSVSLPELETGKDAAISISGELSLKSGGNINISHCSLKNRIAFSLNEELKPAYIDYTLKIDEFSGNINDIKLQDRNIVAALKSKFDKSLDSSTIEEFCIKETAKGETVSLAGLTGNIAFVPLKLDLGVEVSKVSPELIYAFSNGFDIGTPEPSLKSKIFFEDGKLVSTGTVSVKSLKFGKGNMPKVDIETEFDLNADINKKSVGITKLSVIALEGARKLVSVNLSKPTQISWADNKVKIEGDSPKIKALVSALDIATVASFLPPDTLPVTEGRLSVLVEGEVDKNGRDISVNMLARGYELKLKGYERPDLRYLVEIRLDFMLLDGKTLSTRRSYAGLYTTDRKKSFADISPSFIFNMDSGNIDLNIGFGMNSEAIELLPEDLRKQKFWKLTDGYSTVFRTNVKGNIKKKDIQLTNTRFELKNDKSSVAVNAKDPINYNWGKQVSGLKDFPFKATVKINNYPLDRINALMPETGAFKFLSGMATSNLEAVNDGKDLSVKGAIAAKELAFSVNKENYREMNFLYRTDSRMPLNFEGITINNDSIEISSLKAASAEIKFKGPMVFKEFSMDLDIAIEKLNSDILNVLPEKMAESTKLKQFALNGKSHLAMDTKNLEITGTLAALKILTALPALKPDKEINADIAFDMLMENALTEVKSFSLAAFNNAKSELLDLSGNCSVRKENGITDVYMKVTSENIDVEAVNSHLAEKAPVQAAAKKTTKAPKQSTWKKSKDMMGSFLQTTMNALKGAAAPVIERKEPEMISANLDSTEPAAIDLKWLKLKSDIDLRKISWTKHVTASLNTQVTVIDNVIKSDPLLKINNTPVKARIMLDPGLSDGYPFSLAVDMQKLKLSPIFQAAFEDSLAESKGNIDSLSLDAAGKGFSPANLQNKMKASFNMETSDILIKNDIINQFYILQILFLPLEVFAEMKNFMPDNSYSGEIADSISKVRGNINNISLKKGTVNVVADRKIYIKQCEFSGSFIKKLKLEGSAGFNQNLFLTSTLNVGSISMPMDINGTFNSPEPDINKMIPDFLRQNAQNIINSPQEVKETIRKLGNELQEGLKRIKF